MDTINKFKLPTTETGETERYNLGCDLKHEIKNIMGAVLDILKQKSTVGHKILSESKWSLQENNIINFEIDNRYKFFIEQKKIRFGSKSKNTK